MSRSTQTERADVYTGITAEIVAAIEAGAGTCGAGGITRTSSRAATVQNRAGLSGYVAEILSGLILADLGIAHHPRPDHAAYIAPWLQVLKDDPRAIFTAASKAQQAADWMWAQQPQPMAIAA